jgi:hypothetical protein
MLDYGQQLQEKYAHAYWFKCGITSISNQMSAE